MECFENYSSLRQFIQLSKMAGKSIGFVPTMGFLHAGHLSLLREARLACDVVVCSIYVNPTQFNEVKDLQAYPRDVKRDLTLLEKEGCDAVYLPSNEDIYPGGIDQLTLGFTFGPLEKVMEGKHRPGHFNGVAQVIPRLFHQVQPDKAYFGQKDLQQCRIVECLVRDLGFDVQIEVCGIVREEDGLAMSSRNVRLDARQRKLAPVLYQTLQRAEKQLQQYQRLDEVINDCVAWIQQYPEFTLEYFEIVDKDSLQPLQGYQAESKLAVCLAAHLGTARLIDNLIVDIA
ncbi:pantoate--beta-alanine ligase [Rapidithrix thailandica]|uniref:Pantothenate synthetase n=1 Tax=Rapidithrix thailandica TaxID=413964 RepID=A0AAW9S9Q7_9BACT